MGIVNWRQVVQNRDGWTRETGGGAYPSWILEPQRKKYTIFFENPSCSSEVVI